MVLLSHFHLDHVQGLHALGRLRPRGPVRLAGPSGAHRLLKLLLDQPFTMPLRQLPYEVDVLELPSESDRLPLPVECEVMNHNSLTLGYRLRLENRIVAYCPDTGYCANAVRLAEAADLLIAECAYGPGETSAAWPHLNPEAAARIACEAQARRLVLSHFDPEHYPAVRDRSRAVTVARRIFAATQAARDDDIVEL